MATTDLNHFLSGAATLGFFVAALYFLKFWRRTRDQLFALFALAFAMMGAQRVFLLASPRSDEQGEVVLYGFRLAAFVLILVAIIHKNRAATGATPGGTRPPRSRPAGPPLRGPLGDASR